MLAVAAKSLFWQVVDIILPPRCPVSGVPVEEPGLLSPGGWGQIDFIADPACAVCGYPFEFEVEKGALCAACLAEPPPFASARAAIAYGGAGREIVLKFKHGDRLDLIPAFMPWLARAGAEMLARAGQDGGLIVPVPLHRWRLLRRRYNQAAAIARALSARTGIPVSTDILRRVRHTAAQGFMNRKDRKKNVRAAFTAEPGPRIAGKTVILIDDVYTTGATVSECAAALLKAGAAQVHVLTLARVVKPGQA